MIKNLYQITYKITVQVIIKWILLLISFFYVHCSFAIGLGDIKVYSYLNEPLSAEIVLTGVDDLDTNNIIAELASPKDFMRTGIPRPFFLTKLKFQTVRTNGVTVIYISTPKAVKNPFLDFLIQLVWPDGKIIKSYTILLDPQSDTHIRRDLPISKKVGLLEDLSNGHKNNSFNDELMDPDKNLNLSGQLKVGGVSDAIFATSLEESSENEALLKREPKTIVKSTITSETHHPDAMFVTTASDEQIEKYPTHENFDNSQNSALKKVVSSLQAFSEHSNQPKVNYAKLLDLKPNIVTVHKDAEQLAESIAMRQINSELNSLRHKNSESENINDYQSSAAKENMVSNSYLELIKKYGNDLLWTCFLVSTTIFLFHRMMSSNQAADPLVPQSPRTLQNKNFQEEFVNNDFMHTTNNHNILSDLSISHEPDELDDLLKQSTTSNYHDLSMVRNEELELKIALTKQYIAAGDKKSAQDILQEITVVKEQKYQDQISALLKSIAQ